MDDKTRTDLGITDKNEYDFQLEELGWLGQFRWAWNASDPAPRIAARIGLVSMLMSLVGIVFGLGPFLW